MRTILFYIISFLFISIIISPKIYAEGFSANWVDIMILHNGKYRVIIKYTNLKIGEYREAYVDFESKKEAIEVFQKLALGADFYWGDRKTIHFHKTPDKPNPY
ncbi:hypothetical protein [Fluviispira multicolorata]|uniref:Uncharacterized protein n=1 Tax=Fluviispira multicolorata TaxID=2654512 RepID=A0A833JEU8_9BACT|nr:hypothetical protein [Fluviispira multicolorata]KAB8030685.1 hypothetical protein GCL57_06840 [Fluviispira multicolorata]